MFYSDRLGDISDKQLQAALDRFDLGDLVATERIPFGLFGQNLFMTSTRGEFVFRGAPHYDWQLPTECHFAEAIHRRTTVPVPWPFHITTDSEPFPWNGGYALMPRLPGLLLADAAVYASLTWNQRTSLARAQGEMLWHMQHATHPFAGAYDSRTGSITSFPRGYVRRAADRARKNARRARTNGAHDDSDAHWLDALLDRAADLPEPDWYTVVHEDFNRNNMTAAIDGDDVEISGLFDLMTCHYGDGLADLARQFSMFLGESNGDVLARTFVKTYVAPRGLLSPVDVQRTRLYLVDERLLAWEYASRPGNAGLNWWKSGVPLRAWLQRYLDAWESAVSS